jgi:hypothetical protein
MVETAALLADEVLPERPLRQRVLSLPHALRFLLATDPDALTLVLGVAYQAISGHLLAKAGLTRAAGSTGAMKLVQRFGSSLNLNIHVHMIIPDGVFLPVVGAVPVFRHVPQPTGAELQVLVQPIRIVRNFERSGGLDEGDPHEIIECFQSHFPVEGRATAVPPGKSIEFQVPGECLIVPGHGSGSSSSNRA